MSYQAETWVKHTLKYLGASDEALASLFLQAMELAGYPTVSAADAIEAILADFLAGPSLRSEVPEAAVPRCDRHPGWALVWCNECIHEDHRQPEHCGGCGIRIDEGDHRACAAAAWKSEPEATEHG